MSVFLEAGKWYATQSGEVFGPMQRRLAGTYEFYAKSVRGGKYRSWSRFGDANVGQYSAYDLVREVPKPSSNWQPIETAPRDGSEFLAKTADMSERDNGRWAYLSNRLFVVRYIGPGDWALFPGFGASDSFLVGWMPLPEDCL